MPFDINYKAKTTGDGNCGLHTIVHAVSDLFQSGTHLDQKDELAQAFKAYYDINTAFTRHDLKDLIDGTPNPIERQAILTPVLRKMMVESIRLSPASSKPSDARIQEISQDGIALAANELLYLAHTLGIQLESYECNDGLDALSDIRALPAFRSRVANPRILKIRNAGNNHWEFEMDSCLNKTAEERKAMLDAHNAHYQSNRLKVLNSNALKALIRSEIEAGRRKLGLIFAMREVTEPQHNSKQNKFSQISSMIDGLVNNMIGESPNKNDVMANIFKFFSTIIKAFLGFAELATQLGKMNSHEITSEQMDELPAEARKETAKFMSYTRILTQMGGSAQITAEQLNKSWLQALKTGSSVDEIWLELIEALNNNEKHEEALELLKGRENIMVEKLIYTAPEFSKYQATRAAENLKEAEQDVRVATIALTDADRQRQSAKRTYDASDTKNQKEHSRIVSIHQQAEASLEQARSNFIRSRDKLNKAIILAEKTEAAAKEATPDVAERLQKVLTELNTNLAANAEISYAPSSFKKLNIHGRLNLHKEMAKSINDGFGFNSLVSQYDNYRNQLSTVVNDLRQMRMRRESHAGAA